MFATFLISSDFNIFRYKKKLFSNSVRFFDVYMKVAFQQKRFPSCWDHVFFLSTVDNIELGRKVGNESG